MKKYELTHCNTDRDAALVLGITDWDCGDSVLTAEKIAGVCRRENICLYCALKKLGENPLDWGEKYCDCDCDE
jgi:hypothetical protein